MDNLDTTFEYEKAIEELENIVNKLKLENCSLNEAIKLYERGIKLHEFCTTELNKAEQKVLIYNKENNVLSEFKEE